MPEPYLKCMPITLEITFPTRGNTSSFDELAIRNRVEDFLTKAFKDRNCGQWMGCGAGRHRMDISYETTPDKEIVAMEAIDAALAEMGNPPATVTRYHYRDDGEVATSVVRSTPVTA